MRLAGTANRELALDRALVEYDALLLPLE